MLPAAKTHRFSLADVLPNCLDALLGRRGRLGLAPVTHAVVLLADGLGLEALTVRRGHARTLASRLELDAHIGAGFPTTTAAAIATLTTGALPGRHGLVGYTTLDPEHDRVVNQLTGWDDRLDPATWQRMPTVFERAAESGVTSFAVGHSRFRDSGFTAAVLRGAEETLRRSENMPGRIEGNLRVVRKLLGALKRKNMFGALTGQPCLH